MNLSIDVVLDVFDGKLSVGSNKILSAFLVEGEGLHMKVLLDVSIGEHGDILEFQEEAVIAGVVRAALVSPCE